MRAIWLFIGAPLVRSSMVPFSSIKAAILRRFGARIGRGVVIKPGVRVKYPWLLSIGDHSWIGEDAWIDNLAPITVGRNACISQGVYLCTGNHDWSDPAFGLVLKPIVIGDGAWAGARSVIAPGVSLAWYAIVCAGSVVTRDVPEQQIYGGNPAVYLKHRRFSQESSSNDNEAAWLKESHSI